MDAAIFIERESGPKMRNRSLLFAETGVTKA
jgi:hypothetical protein